MLDEYMTWYRDERIKTEYEQGSRPVEKRPRILVTGCPIGGNAMKVVKSIEANGGNVVCYENCSGAKSVDELINEDTDDIYQAIADRYLNIGCSCMTPDENRFKLMGRLLDEYKIDAVVEVVLQACHTYNVETALVGKLVKEKKGIPYTQTTDLESVIPQLDVLYMTRIQRERFASEEEYQRLKDSYILTPKQLEKAKPDMYILHPLPRVNEISVAVDSDPRAAYFTQVFCGKIIRMALIMKLLDLIPEPFNQELPAPERDTSAPVVHHLHCTNPRCITTIEQELPQSFRLADEATKTYRCIYCETLVQDK